MDIRIREAQPSDAGAIHDIYGYYTKNTYVTFTEKNPTVEEYKNSIIETKKAYPYIVAVDESDKVVGMAYAGQIRHHDAYLLCVCSGLILPGEP